MQLNFRLYKILNSINDLFSKNKSSIIVLSLILISVAVLYPGENNKNYLEKEIPIPATIANNQQPEVQDIIEIKENWKKVKIKPGDNLTKIFKDFNIPYAELHSILASNPNAKYLKDIKPGQSIHFLFDEEIENASKLKELKVDIKPTKTLSIKNIDNGKYKFDVIKQDIQIKMAYAEADIRDSLYSSGNKAGIKQSLLSQLVDIFSWDIDFALDIREGDKLRILFEEKFINDKKIGTGNIIAAEFINNGKIFQAILNKDKEGRGFYYSPDGFSLQKAFIRTPVKFTRISSKFSLGRKHPVLHRIRAHKGVDYAAPTGTPVKATGNGKVFFIGKKGGYGNCIILKHGDKYTTLYGHLSRFAKNLKQGANVIQGQIIGYVGQSGLATGPHLHYEFRINGVHKDPLRVPLPKTKPIPKSELAKFKTHANKMLALLDYHQQLYLVKND